jgi:DNA-binding transcriptional LysR family regulator
MGAFMELNKLLVFIVVSQERSFTLAAQRLHQDKAQVSRSLKALEASLGATLLIRTTRAVRLTPEGEALFRRVAPLVAELEQALSAVPAKAAIPAGDVLITTTPDLGRGLLAPALIGFRHRFPGVRVKIVLTHDLVDLSKDGVDLALRVGRPGKSKAVIAKKLGEVHAGFFASPGYIERRGMPSRLEELRGHDGLWPMPSKTQRAFAAAASRPIVECADFDLLAELARLGGGIALLPRFLASREVSAGNLIRVLPEISYGGAPLYLLSAPTRPLPRRVSSLKEHLIAFVNSSLWFAKGAS